MYKIVSLLIKSEGIKAFGSINKLFKIDGQVRLQGKFTCRE